MSKAPTYTCFLHDQKTRVLVIHEDGMLVAQCLEYDICTQAPVLETLQDRFSVLSDCYRDESFLREGEEFKGLNPAPDKFHQIWETVHEENQLE